MNDDANTHAMECLQLVPDKDKDYSEKLCRKKFVWWSVQLNGVDHANVVNRQDPDQGQARRRPGH